MPIPLYLAMTGAEFLHSQPLPPKIAWMACHFSPYGTGISNLPPELPEESLLILNDRTPVNGHDPQRVAAEMAQLAAISKCSGILLDLQHPGLAETEKIVQAISQTAPCPVAVSEYYCQSVDCAVFLTPPLHIPLSDYLIPWKDRDIWLEAATEEVCFTVTQAGCQVTALPCQPTDFPHRAPGAFSRYHIAVEEERIRFSFQRAREDVEAMLESAEGIQCFVGLYQQFS